MYNSPLLCQYRNSCLYMPYKIPQLERDHWHAFFSSVCTPDNTGVPDVSESRFSVPGERPVAKAQMFYQGELTLWIVHEPQGSDRSSCFSTLSLSNFEFIFHTPVFFPSHLCPPTIQKVGLRGALPAPDDELECSEMSRKDTLFYAVNLRNAY